MPTGYTAKLIEKGQTFEEFVLTCARAFGACVEMRDNSLDVLPPEEFPVNPYYIEAVEKAKENLRRLRELSGKVNYGHKKRTQCINDLEQSKKQNALEHKRLEDMVQKVNQWNPPSKDHEELKKFMLQQLSVSKGLENSWYNSQLDDAMSKSALDYYDEELIQAEQNLEYYTKELEKQKQRAKGNTQWVKQLRDSLNEQNLDKRV